MAKHITTWRPDTCGCVLHYEWDDEVPQDERVHTPVVIEGQSATCKAHQATTGGGYVTKRGEQKALHAQVLAENQGKNKAYAKIMEKMPHLCDDVDDGAGGKTRRLKPEHELSWLFDNNRKLTIKVRGVTDAQVTAALKD